MTSVKRVQSSVGSLLIAMILSPGSIPEAAAGFPGTSDPITLVLAGDGTPIKAKTLTNRIMAKTKFMNDHHASKNKNDGECRYHFNPPFFSLSDIRGSDFEQRIWLEPRTANH